MRARVSPGLENLRFYGGMLLCLGIMAMTLGLLWFLATNTYVEVTVPDPDVSIDWVRLGTTAILLALAGIVVPATFLVAAIKTLIRGREQA